MTDIIVGKKLNKPGEHVPYDKYVGYRISMIPNPIGIIYYAGTNASEAEHVERISRKRNAKFEWIKGVVEEKAKPKETLTPVKPVEESPEELKAPSFKITT